MMIKMHLFFLILLTNLTVSKFAAGQRNKDSDSKKFAQLSKVFRLKKPSEIKDFNSPQKITANVGNKVYNLNFNEADISIFGSFKLLSDIRWWGRSVGEFPNAQILVSASGTFEKEEIIFPSSAILGLSRFDKYFTNVDKEVLHVYFKGGGDGEGYTVEFVFKNGRLMSRNVTSNTFSEYFHESSHYTFITPDN